MDVLEFSWLSFGFAVVNFIVLVALLARFLHRPLLDVLERRRRRIETAEREAQAKADEARAAEETYREKLAGIEQERDGLLTEARRRAEEAREKVLEEARQAADREVANLKRDWQRRRRDALEQLRDDVVSMAIDLAGGVLHKLSDEDIQAKLHARLLAELDALAGDAARADLTDGRTPVKVVSAGPLDPPQQQKVRQHVEALAGGPVEIEFETDEALVAGARVEFSSVAVDASLADVLSAVRERMAPQQTEADGEDDSDDG